MAEIKRDVAGEDEDLGRVVGDGGHRGSDRVAGAAGLILEGELGAVREDLADRLDGRRVDDHGAHGVGATGGRCFAPCIQDVRQHRPPAQRVQHLGERRLHARAQTRREDHGGGSAGLPRHGLGTWRVHARRRACAGRWSPALHAVPDGRKRSVIRWKPDGMGGPPGPSSAALPGRAVTINGWATAFVTACVDARRSTAGYTVRAATLEDAGFLAELFNAVTLDEVGVAWTDAADMRADLAAPGFDLANDAALVLDAAGRLDAGFLLHPNGSPVSTVLAIGLVRPEATGRGLGTYITSLAEEHAQRKIPLEAATGRFTVRTPRFVQNEAAAVLFRDLGYEPVRTWWRMAIELGGGGPEASLPSGIDLAPFEPERDSRPAYDALEEAFRDHWGMGMGGFEDWVNRVVDRSASHIVLVAREGAEIAGVLVGRAGLAADAEAGSVEELGVRRTWRGRGVGLALLHVAFDEFRRRGLARARLTVDSESPTGATRLYERAGMAVELAWEHWEKELRSA